jgi:hypothetical protein
MEMPQSSCNRLSPPCFLPLEGLIGLFHPMGPQLSSSLTTFSLGFRLLKAKLQGDSGT